MTYRILDEPRPGGLAHLAVNPLWPLLAVMLGGVWLSWPWFVVNGFAVGSPTRFRELGLAIGGLIGATGLLFGLGFLRAGELMGDVAFSYAIVALVVWLVRSASGPGTHHASPRRASGLDVLDERYARGEIKREEYLQKRKDIGA